MLKRIGAEEGGEFKAVASGTLPSGQPVIVNADGTVSVVSQTSVTEGVGSPVVFESSTTTNSSAVYDSYAQKVVIAYTDGGNSSYGTAIVGTVSGTSISFGTAVVFESASSANISATYDSNAQKVVIAYKDVGNSEHGTAIVGTVSGTSISFGSAAVFESASTEVISATYDANAQKVVVAYRDFANSSKGTAVVGTVSGTSISFGSPVIFEQGGISYSSAVYDSNAQKVVITYRDNGNSYYGTAIVGTVSGTSISFGSAVVFESANSEYISGVYDSNAQKVVIAYQDGGNSNYGTAIVGTVSGTSISFGSAVVFESGSSSFISPTYDANVQKVVIAYRDVGNSNYGTVIVGTVSGTSISFGSASIFESANSNHISATYDANAQKVVIAYTDSGNNDYGTSIVFQNASTTNNLTSENYIGMSRGVAFQSPVTQAVGTPVAYKQVSNAYGPVIFDSNSNKVVIAYIDSGDSSKGKCVVGTVSGTSISFGSEVTFETTSNTTELYGTFDSTNNKVILVYRQNYSTGNAIVGTVSGNSISFGSTAAFSSNNPIYFGVAFDSTNNKIVISYRAIGNSNYGTAVVGTVSGTSISFGSEVVFKSARSDYTNCVHDSTNNKAVVTWTDQPNSNSQTAIVGTVSGTSISFGSAVVYFTAASYPKLVFNPDTGTVVAVFTNSSNLQGSSKIGTVSGTSISFSAESIWKSTTGTATEGLSLTYDSNAKKIVIGYRDGNNGNDGYLITGTVGSSSITYDTPVEFADYDVSDTHAGFDSVSNKVIIAYADARNTDNYGTAVVFRNASTDTIRGEVASGQAASMDIIGSVSDNQIGLTAGQQYFVQTDGTIGTTAGSPSVLAGTAISATELVVKT